MEHEINIAEDGFFTFAFSITNNRWRGNDRYESEGLSSVPGGLYSYKNGKLWEHDVMGQPINSFYGVLSSSFIGVILTGESGAVKVPQSVSVESRKSPSSGRLSVTLPKPLTTEIKSVNFSSAEGIHLALIKKAGGGLNRVNGKEVRGPWAYLLLEFSGDTPIELRFINIVYHLSHGANFV